jgi:hypothetical protein
MEVESKVGPLGTSAICWPFEPTPGDFEDGEFGRGNLTTMRKPSQHHIVHHKFHLTRLGLEPGQQQWDTSDYSLELWSGRIGHLVADLPCELILTLPHGKKAEVNTVINYTVRHAANIVTIN